MGPAECSPRVAWLARMPLHSLFLTLQLFANISRRPSLAVTREHQQLAEELSYETFEHRRAACRGGGRFPVLAAGSGGRPVFLRKWLRHHMLTIRAVFAFRSDQPSNRYAAGRAFLRRQ